MGHWRVYLRAAASAVGVVAGLFALGASFAPTASADSSGACSATIAGVDVQGLSPSDPGDAIPVAEGSDIPVTMSAPGGLESHTLRLEYAGIRWTVSSETDEGQTSVDDEIAVSDYATYGVGLYRVSGEGKLLDGTACKGAVLVDVQGNPLTTVAGVAAVGMVVGGGAGVAAATVREARRPPKVKRP